MKRPEGFDAPAPAAPKETPRASARAGAGAPERSVPREKQKPVREPRVRPEKVTGLHRVDEAPVKHVPMADSLASSPLSAALDPRVADETVEEQMKTTPAPAPAVPEAAGVPEAEEESRPG